MGTEGYLPGVKQPWREVDHSPPSSAEVKNAWSYTSALPYVFMASYCLKLRDNFSFILAYLHLNLIMSADADTVPTYAECNILMYVNNCHNFLFLFMEVLFICCLLRGCTNSVKVRDIIFS
jgi:hypothetical protein